MDVAFPCEGPQTEDVHMESGPTETVDQLPHYSKTQRKIRRNSGKSYATKLGKVISERKCVPMGACRKKCKDKISYDEQGKLFDNYWSLGSYNKRLLYISGLLDIGEKLTQTLKKSLTNPKNRQNSTYYYLEISGNRTNVCKMCFIKCFGETEGFIRCVLSKKLSSALNDRRGSSTPKNKLSDSQIAFIKSHIQSFPAYESHYCRSHSSKKYLSSDLSISKMHKLYCDQYKSTVSITKYSSIFHTMNLKFKVPKLDTCNKCDLFKAKLENTEKDKAEYAEIMEEQTRHHKQDELAYKSKENDKNIAKSDKKNNIAKSDIKI